MAEVESASRTARLTKAVEFAHYLAKGADQMLEAASARDAIQLRIDEGEEDLEVELADANETVFEYSRGLRSDIYEFRKRAERIGVDTVQAADSAGAAPAPSQAAPPGEQGSKAVASSSPQARELGEVPDYVAAAQRGTGLTTYWLYYGIECVGTVRMPPGTGAVDVRNEAAKTAVIFCDRARGENPGERRLKIMHSTVKVYDDRPVQERMRRDLPFEFRGLFPNELPFLEMTIRSLEPEAVAAVHVRDMALGVQNVALAAGLEVSFKACGDAQRLVRVQSADREALGRVELALKGYLAERGAELVSEFGVGYIRAEANESETETEVERPRG